MAVLAGAGALGLLGLVASTLAASDHSSGDGSDADNERLLPDVYPADPVLSDGSWLREPYHPFFDVDWSVSLRGSYTESTEGERFDMHVVPSVGLEHIGTRSAINFDAEAEITKPDGEGEVDVTALRLNLETGYALDSATRLTATGNFTLDQPLAGTPGVASDIAIPAETISGGASLGMTREMGKFNLSLNGAAQRNIYGPTTLTDGTVRDNWRENYWALDSNLRIGFQATPIFEVFADGGIGRDIFGDDLAVSTNATDYTISGGVTGRWSSIWEATASTGVGLRRFDADGLDEVVTQLYDAAITFTPDPTWRMTAGFATIVAPPGPTGTGTTRVDYTARAEIGYTVNSWLALRALADWNSARFEGTEDTETGRGFGVGADYMVNAHTDVSADYGYDLSDSSTTGLQEAHRVTLGITVKR